MASIEKSPKDLREYKAIVLSNSLKCVLVSDPDTETSAASINVHVGSVFETIPGLAHYLEHMLFMGTEKFPEENEFSNFLSENAGESNAFTDHEDTNFYFKVSSDQFSTGLDMFAQFFIAPLFNESSLQRELKAIDSEFHKNLLDDLWRMQQVLYSYFEHPIDHFSLGNSSTLTIPEIRSKIIEFYSSLYSAKDMSLVVYGAEDLEELEKMAQVFADIPSKDNDFKQFLRRMKKKPGITKLVPVKDNKSLRLVWNLPSCREYFETKPEGYLGHLLGHEGKGSILSYLKSLNLAEELCSSFNDDFSFCGFFTVEVKLTDKGFQMVEEVVEAVFAYLDMLKTNGPKSYVFEELQRVAWAQFLFRNKKDPYGFCSKLSSRMAKYPVSKILTAPELYTSFDAEIVAEITNLLTFDNLQLFLVSKTWNKELMTQEPYFGTYFSYEEIPENLKNKILKPKSLPFHLPDINSYIPDTFETLELGTSKYPEVLLKNERLEVYFKQDSKFEIDKVYGQLVIFCTSADFSHNPCMFMCAKMWEKLLNEKLREETYLADLAGLKHDFEVDNHGVRVSLNGFSQKYPNFLRFLLEKISNFKPSSEDQSLFDDLKNELMTSIANCYFSKPTVQVQRVIYELNLQGGYFTQLEKLRALNEIDLKDVIWFSLKWLNHCYFQWFLMGNIRKESALELAVSCTDQFLSGRSGCFDKNDFLRLKITKIPKNSPEIFILPLTDTSNSNSVMVSLYQIGPESIEDECLVSLVENYLEEPFFDELRTKEQLGYIVNSYSHKMRGVFHFIFMIQSSTHSPEIVFAKIQEFLRCSLESVQNISDKKFKKLKKSTLETSFKKDLSLYEEFQRYRHEIDSAALVFNRKQLVKEKFKEVTKENFIQFYFKMFRDCFRRIDICLASNAMHEALRIERNVKVFKGLKEFRLSHSAWPQVHKMK